MKLVVLLALIVSTFANASDNNKKCAYQHGDDILAQSDNFVMIKDKCLISDYVTDSNVDMDIVNEFLKLENQTSTKSIKKLPMNLLKRCL